MATYKKTFRRAKIARKTRETDILLELNLDGSGKYDLQTPVPFLNHLLTVFSVHGFFDLSVQATGDTEIDDHHSVEDIGICLGKAIAEALQEKAGIVRYGHSYLPMDEALVRVVLDISNRPFLQYNVNVAEQKLGAFDTFLAKEFFRAVSHNAGLTMHIDQIHGENGHHVLEAAFKGFGRALRIAVAETGSDAPLSSKGSL